MKRVVITGIGAITPLANNFIDSWSLLNKGISGIDRITRFDVEGLRWKVAGEVKGFDPNLFLSKKEASKLDLFVQYAVAAALIASKDAGLLRVKLEDKLTRQSGVIIGSSRGGITTIEKELSKLLTLNAKLSPYIMPSSTINMAASYTAQKLGINGLCLGVSNACASGANAIGEAYRAIKHGYSDIIFAGGTEAPVCRLCVEGYGMSNALSKINSPSASRPFDRNRDGFVIAEGACILVLESYESAIKRDAKIYAEIIGYSNTTDAFHITKPDPEGEAMCINMALKDANILMDNIDYINAHGTSTILGDEAESSAVNKLFKDRANKISASALKSMTGHMLAASGAFETACTAMSIKENKIPPTINIKEKDIKCSINIITENKEADINIAITNSFGFGGVNAVLVLKKVENG